MLSSPAHAIFGCRHLAPSIQFFEALGFELTGRGRLPARASYQLYGLEGTLEEASLFVRGTSRGWLRLVETPHGPSRRESFDNGPLVLNLYCRHIDHRIADLRRQGYVVSPTVRNHIGPFELRQTRVFGPSGEEVVLVDMDRRRPSALDHDSRRTFSEAHSISWVVESLDEASAFWVDRARLQVLFDATLKEPGVATLLELPEPSALRVLLLSGSYQEPIRLELFELGGDSLYDTRPPLSASPPPLRSGLYAPAFEVTDLPQAVRGLRGALFGPTVELSSALHPSARAVTAIAPGGVRFELWQTSRPG